MDIQYSWRKPVNVLIGISVLGLACILFSGELTRRAAHAKHDRAQEAFRLDMPEEALLLLREAVDADPDNPEFHISLAMAYINYRWEAMGLIGISLAELYQEIMKEASAAHSLQPDDADITRLYAYLFFDADTFGSEPDWRAALEIWKGYLLLHELDTETKRSSPITWRARSYSIFLFMARIESRRGQEEEVRNYLKRALEAYPDRGLDDTRYVQKFLQRRNVKSISTAPEGNGGNGN